MEIQKRDKLLELPKFVGDRKINALDASSREKKENQENEIIEPHMIITSESRRMTTLNSDHNLLDKEDTPVRY